MARNVARILYCRLLKDQAPRHVQISFFDPDEELSDRMHVVFSGVGVGDLGLEEFLPGKLGRLTSGLDDRGGIAGGDRFCG
jgi:hypothetical protein